MKVAARTLLLVAVGGIALPTLMGAQSTPTTASGETRIQLGNLLVEDRRYWEAIRVFDEAREYAVGEQLTRVLVGMVKALLSVAEFTRAQVEAQVLSELAPEEPEAVAIIADALWAGGLFDEAEAGQFVHKIKSVFDLIHSNHQRAIGSRCFHFTFESR